MNYIFILTFLFSIALTSSSESEFVTCDSQCNLANNLTCEALKKDCINGYRKWKNYSKNVLKIGVTPTSNFEIVIKPKNGPLMKNLTVKILVFHCNSSECTTFYCDLETNFIYDFVNGI